MKTTTKRVAFGLCLFVLTSGAGVTLNACSRARLQKISIKIDGFSPVFPITEAVAKEFQKTQAEEVEINIDFTGTGGGFRKFCAGETDISNASRPFQRGVSADPNALGCFGYPDYETNQNQLQPLGIDNGRGPVLPSLKTVEKAEYQPLSRPLLIYINAKSAQTKPEVKAFVDFYLKNASTIVKSVGYVPLPDEGYRLGEVHFHRGNNWNSVWWKSSVQPDNGRVITQTGKVLVLYPASRTLREYVNIKVRNFSTLVIIPEAILNQLQMSIPAGK